jgi:hypothetical protein
MPPAPRPRCQPFPDLAAGLASPDLPRGCFAGTTSTSVSRGSSRDRCDQRSCRRPQRNRCRSDCSGPPRARTDRELNQEDRSSWLRSHATRNPRTSVGLRNVIYYVTMAWRFCWISSSGAYMPQNLTRKFGAGLTPISRCLDLVRSGSPLRSVPPISSRRS